jgi:hypothetical protein
MASAAPTEFPIVRCAPCAREVLGYLDLDERDREIVRCLACATTADPNAVRFGDLAAIEAIGYGFVLPEGGCGRPDCGQGRCGRSAP